MTIGPGTYVRLFDEKAYFYLSPSQPSENLEGLKEALYITPKMLGMAIFTPDAERPEAHPYHFRPSKIDDEIKEIIQTILQAEDSSLVCELYETESIENCLTVKFGYFERPPYLAERYYNPSSIEDENIELSFNYEETEPQSTPSSMHFEN